MSEFFKLNPARWMHGTECLSGEQEFAYFKIICAIHLYDAPIAANSRTLAGLFKTTRPRAMKILDELVKAGKVEVNDGVIHQERAESELRARQEQRESKATAGREGGINSGIARSKILKTKEPAQAPASNETNKNRIEENRIEEKRIESEQELPLGNPSVPTTNGHKVKVSRKTRLDKDWQPTREDLQVGIELGLSQKKITDEFEKFQDHASATGRVMVNWGSAFRMWLRKAAEYEQSKTQRL